MSGVEVHAILQFGKALYDLKCKYDQHKDNQREISELQVFIEQYEAQVPELRRRFRQCRGNPAGDTALRQLETEISNATGTVQRWCTGSSNFFTMLTSPQRLKEIQKLHRSLMGATQKHLSVASISMLLDIRAEQANLRGHLTSDLKSLLISGMADISQAVAEEVRVAASEASRASYADEKFWADVLAALERNDVNNVSTAAQPGHDQDIPDRFLDPILADVMIDPVLASNGITYCRWTILENNMTQDPHNPNENLIILGDNVSLRSELFERFPDLANKFRQRRDSYRSEALSLAARGRLADAMVALQHVLRWDKKDAQCLAALAQVQEKMRNLKAREVQPSSRNQAAARSPNMVSRTDSVVPDSSTSSSVIAAQKKASQQCGVQKPQTITKIVAPPKPLQNSTASSLVASNQILQGSRDKSLTAYPPQRRPPVLPHSDQIPPKTESERRLARPPSWPHTGGTTQAYQTNLAQERQSLQKGEESSQYYEEFIPTPVQRSQQLSVKPAPSYMGFSSSGTYPGPSKAQHPQQHLEGPITSLPDPESGASSQTKWMIAAKVADKFAGALFMSPVGPVEAYKEIKKRMKDNGKKTSMGGTKGGSADVGAYSGHHEQEGHIDPGCGAQVQNGSRYMVNDYSGQWNEINHSQGYEGYSYGGYGYVGNERANAHETVYEEAYPSNQEHAEYYNNSAQQFAYSNCTSEEARRRHLARLAANNH